MSGDLSVFGDCLKCLYNLWCWLHIGAELKSCSVRLNQISWRFPALLYFCCCTQVADWPRQSGRARVQTRGFMEDLADCSSNADAFPMPWPPQFTRFIISSLPRWLSLICLCLWSNSHWESLIVSIMTTFAGHAEFFCCRFLSIWCPHSSPALIDCTYPGLFTVTVPNAHTSSGLLGFYVSKRHFCVSPLLYKLKSK